MDAPVGAAGGDAAAAVVEGAVPTESAAPVEPTKKREDMSPAEKKEAQVAEVKKIDEAAITAAQKELAEEAKQPGTSITGLDQFKAQEAELAAAKAALEAEPAPLNEEDQKVVDEKNLKNLTDEADANKTLKEQAESSKSLEGLKAVKAARAKEMNDPAVGADEKAAIGKEQKDDDAKMKEL